ncbi:hypothetical protein KC335_g142 [Hortaea werneckii]|nr:hypothetical protein KC335_g142 [Hortaea werneckii]
MFSPTSRPLLLASLAESCEGWRGFRGGAGRDHLMLNFFGSVPSISWASFALRSCRLACRAVSKEATACAFFLSTILPPRRVWLGKLHMEVASRPERPRRSGQIPPVLPLSSSTLPGGLGSIPRAGKMTSLNSPLDVTRFKHLTKLFRLQTNPTFCATY